MISTKVLNQACTLEGPVAFSDKESEKPRTPPPSNKSPTEKQPALPIISSTNDLNTESEKARKQGLCPCIVVDSKTRRQKICNVRARFGDVCGRHKDKCNLPEGEPAVEVETKEQEELPQLMLDEPANDARQQGLCPCIITKKNGEKSICMNKAKFNGVCGLHKKKCNLPSHIATLPVIIEEEEAQPKLVAPTKRVVEADISEVKQIQTCPCILSSKRKPGELPRVCGRKIKTNGRCGIHQKKCVMPEGEQLPETEKENSMDKLSQQIEIDKQPQTDFSEVDTLDELAQQLEADFPEDSVDTLDELAQQLEADFLEEGGILDAPSDILNDDLPRVQIEQEIDKDWPVIPVANMEDIIQYVEKLDRKPQYDLSGLADINIKIRACFNL